ncbi:fibronectin-III type domain-containing protein windei [Anticarsia gemmatalis]|uniref:fibronectin-III type domain-containing protein windei n=1 Tax=Anticarsia gemmatalis TaxID=129554 RepID=UPI003F774467
MQLIVEAENTLDIERNMSTLEDVSNNKMESLAIEENNKNKCNGDTEVIQIEDDESQEKPETVSLPDSPITLDNNVTELRNVELSEIISIQNSIKVEDAQNTESQNDSLDNEIFALGTKEGPLNPVEAEQDDYEDDIISLSGNLSENKTEKVEKTVTDGKESVKQEKVVENQDDVIELIAESPVPEESNADSQKDDDSIVILDDEAEESPIQVDDDKTESNESEKDIKVVDSDKSPAPSENDANVSEKPVKDAFESIKASLDPCTEDKIDSPKKDEEMEISTETEPTNPSEKQIEDMIDESEKDNMTLVYDEDDDDGIDLTEKDNDDMEKDITDSVEKDIHVVKEDKASIAEGDKANASEHNISPVEVDQIKLAEENKLSVTEKEPESVAEGNKTSNIEENMAILADIEKKLESLGEGERREKIIVEADKITVAQEEKVSEEISVAEEDEASVAENDATVSKVDQVVAEENGITLEDVEMKPVEEMKEVLVDKKDETDSPMDEPTKDESTVETQSTKTTAECVNKEALKESDKILVEEEITPTVVSSDVKDTPTSVDTTNGMDITDSIETETVDVVKSNEMDKSESVKVSDNKVDTPVAQTDEAMEVEDSVEQTTSNTETKDSPIKLKDNMVVEKSAKKTLSKEVISIPKEMIIKDVSKDSVIDKPIICKLSNTLDIFSDEEDEEPSKTEPAKVASPEPESVSESKVQESKDKQSIDIEDDDDIMVIDEDRNNSKSPDQAKEISNKLDVKTDLETGEKTVEKVTDSLEKAVPKEPTPPASPAADTGATPSIKEKSPERKTPSPEPIKPLIPENFLKTTKTKLSDMTREELEEFCVLKIVESIVDRSSLSDIKVKLRTMAQGLEEFRKKAMMLTKQNRDLQVVLKSVQEEQKKPTGDTPIMPLKITRSVGMQVYMEKTVITRKRVPVNNNKNQTNQQNKNTPQNQQANKKQGNQNIPVPRLVPANNPALKTPSTIPQVTQTNSPAKNVPNGVKNASPATSASKAEKRPHNKVASSVTVDLTDDEPPSKVPGGPKASPAPPVRLVPPQSLMAPQRPPFVNSPRKVYIPISGPQNQQLRPGQTIMLKTVVPSGMRPRGPASQVARMDGSNGPVRLNRVTAVRHPAPLPVSMKQYTPPNWKPLPPAPDLKLSKVENGIVISWKIEGVPEDYYEEIASYQLYAYQETSTPPSTSLWKKIGDVKALPLPMACTLTQFMAGFKYYFAVRAVDIRSRLGPFSLPGSILLLSKNN